MDEPPTLSSKLDLGFLAKDVRAEAKRLVENCILTRGYGLEQRMDHGRALLALRSFLKQYDEPELENHFDVVCDLLEEAPSEARRRIALAVSWDAIRQYLDDNGLSVRMPEIESHVAALFPIDVSQRGAAWAAFWQRATEDRLHITQFNIAAWVSNYKALPMEVIEQLEAQGKEDLEFDIEEEVPEAAKYVTAITQEEAPPEDQEKGHQFKHPEKVRDAIERIAEACGGGDPKKMADWRALLSDPIKIRFEDVLEWGSESRTDIQRIGKLVAGDLHKGLHQAMRIIRVLRGQVYETTSWAIMRHCCLANSGRWEHEDGPYKITVTYNKQKDYT